MLTPRRVTRRNLRCASLPAICAVVAAVILAGCRAGPPPPAGSTAGPPTIEELTARPEPLTIAHAGGDAVRPHSTPFGYAESVAEGADVLELDVQLSADGVLVVHHDETVDATTEATGPVVERTVAELQALDAAYRWSPCPDCTGEERTHPFRGVRTGARPPPAGYLPGDFAIPTLEQIATRFPEHPLDIEIKGERHSDPVAVARALAGELRRLDRTDSSVVVSFDSTVVEEFHALAPEVAVSPGGQELAAWILSGRALAEHYSIIQLPPEVDGVPVLDAELVERAHAEGLAVWVWASDVAQERAETYRQWLALGVDGVIAGSPAEMAAARSTQPRSRRVSRPSRGPERAEKG